MKYSYTIVEARKRLLPRYPHSPIYGIMAPPLHTPTTGGFPLMVDLKHGAAIVGIHEHATRYAPDKSELWISVTLSSYDF